MHWIEFLFLGAVIIVAGRYLARDGEILAEKTGMGRTWIGTVLIAATTSLPELFSGVGSTAVFPLPEIAVGDVLGSCMFNLLTLSMMDAIGGNAPLSARASPGHALSIGLGCMLMGTAGISIAAASRLPSIGWIGITTPILFAAYLLAANIMFRYERKRSNGQTMGELLYEHVSLRTVLFRYSTSALVVVTAAIFLPGVGATIAAETGLEQGFVGTILIAVATSLPEVAVSLAAVRMGAIDLAVGNVLGSNLFNILILGIDDLLYVRGPILGDVSPKHAIAVLAVLTMNGIVLTGLTYQAVKKRLVVAWDTFAIVLVYLFTITVYLRS